MHMANVTGARARARNHLRPTSGAGGSLLCPGRNCWTTAIAERARVLIDGAAYFRELEAALEQAERSVIILGWDFDGRISLRPDRPEDPVVLGPFLRSLVERRPHLEIRILVWSFSIIHAPGASLPLLVGSDWEKHPRIVLKLDTEHPFYGAHHQKIVCIDDRIAFVGGMDLTVERWDSEEHAVEDQRRLNCDGAHYGPVHDIQMSVEGEAAVRVADFARERWRIATGEALERCERPGDDAPPHTEHADFVQTPVAIVRTSPAWKRQPARREAFALTRDLLECAQKFIYIEAQYFTAAFIGDVLRNSLSRQHGPEIVAVLRAESEGFLERRFMAENRDRLLRRIKKADRYDRLRVFSPAVRDNDRICHILVHSKLIIADDQVLKVGSSNLNNRSVELDTECDLALEAQDDRERAAIARIRERLLAEHLGTQPDEVARALEEHGSLIAAVERLNGRDRFLAPFEHIHSHGPTRPVWGTRFIDPERPFRILGPLMRPLTRFTRRRRASAGGTQSLQR